MKKYLWECEVCGATTMTLTDNIPEKWVHLSFKGHGQQGPKGFLDGDTCPACVTALESGLTATRANQRASQAGKGAK